MIETREWTSRTGETRHYVQNLTDLLDLDVARYKSGNISSAALRGERISNAEAGRIAGTRVWLDGDATVHVDGHSSRILSAEEIVAAVEAVR